MRISLSLLLPLAAGLAEAASATAEVYIFSNPRHRSLKTTPSLTPQEARLVVAERLGVSQYHSLKDASSNALEYINVFGDGRSELFANNAHDPRRYLVLVVESVSPTIAKSIQGSVGASEKAFEISSPPSIDANAKLVHDLSIQSLQVSAQKCSVQDDINPFEEQCWGGNKRKIRHLIRQDHIEDLVDGMSNMMRNVESEAMDVMMIFFTSSRKPADRGISPYGTYDMPSRHHARQAEEPLELQEPASNELHSLNYKNGYNANTSYPRGIFPSCYSTNDSCTAATNNCSGHGHCYAKYSSDRVGESCFTCQCIPSVMVEKKNGKELWHTQYWGGPACSKQDVSGQFWLLAGFSVILVGLVSWAIGMMFSIGEEKLPGVIGAGVSGPKAR